MNPDTQPQTPHPLTDTDGTGRDDRLKGLPAPPELAVDGMDLTRRLALAAAFSDQVAFIGDGNLPAGSWKGTFTTDASMLLALIACSPLEDAEKKMRRYRGRHRGEAGWAMGALIYKVARLLNDWYHALTASKGPEPSELGRALSELIQSRLGDALASLFLAGDALERELPDKRSFADPSAFHPVWSLSGRMQALEAGETGESGVHADLFSPFYNAALHIREKARQQVPRTLATGDHDPAAGLFIAFLTLYQRAADRINEMPGRHRDLYYDNILGFSLKPRRSDSLYLTLFSDGSQPVVPVPAETLFFGGKESLGHDAGCRTSRPLLVHQGRVARVETLFFERHPLITPECDLGLVSSVRHAGCAVADPAADEAPSEGVGWSLFGAHHSEGEEGGEATLGFAVAAPLLLLAEGHRHIEMTVHTHPLDAGTTDLFHRTLATLEQSRKEGRTGALRLLFGSAFHLYLSAEGGWHPVSDCTLSVGLSEAGPTLVFQMDLEPRDPAVVPCTAEMHGDINLGEPGAPVLRAVLNPKAHVNPYTLLSRMRLTRIVLRVKVDGARNLSLANNLGMLDANTPFAPFGPLPKCGSFLVLGHRESTGKEVKKLTVEFSWAELPASSGGFARYYRAYGGAIDNGSFKVKMAVLKQGQWVEDAESPGYRLFSEDPGPGDKPATTGALVCTSEKLLDSVPDDEGTFVFGPGVCNGFYRFQLVAPEMAFGHALYPQLLTRGLMKEAKAKGKIIADLPNAPYTPMVSRLSLDYEAVETLDLSCGQGAGQFYHLYPSGYDRLDDREEGETIPLIPDADGDGHLFLGISGQRLAGMVNLLFCLEGDGVHSFHLPLPETRWAYLEADRWQALPDRCVLLDSTRGFLTSGLVVLDLPASGLSSDHTVMPTGFFWLRAIPMVPSGDPATLQNVMASLSRCRTVVLNGVLARLDHETTTDASVPGGSAFRPATPLAGVGTVRQLLDSFGGRGEESAEERMARIGERLRHKGRAVTSWDVERLLLEREPAIRKVKCFPGMSLERREHPGRLLVAVLPDRQGQGSMPPLFTILELGRMAGYLKGLLPDHAEVDVINPVYERIQVRCTLTLREGQGDALKRVHRSISDFLSPWVLDVGYPARFGWCVREVEVEAHIAAHPDVVSVTDFSMLHLIRSPEEGYAMVDTVIMAGDRADDVAQRPCEGVTDEEVSITLKEIRPATPWSIAVPADAHYLQTIPEPRPIAPQRTGVGELEVGRTFIV
ncbi:baseplate J/gp47 family protein [Desulfoluna spongiiphila]|uniref:baseplate J/gp47 family protein n=1 Tax=Desulfoluna spongiiphila TaxID=419481 RepID=UPI0012585E40|nr:baseplate J/gp47 family protein [Desulfoluna spongiiphila]VVS95081.1 consensus disorder prediction [Desulfoluna spongiiphila]